MLRHSFPNTFSSFLNIFHLHKETCYGHDSKTHSGVFIRINTTAIFICGFHWLHVMLFGRRHLMFIPWHLLLITVRINHGYA